MPDSKFPRQVSHWVEERLREAILDGEFAPGVWLRQKHLAEELGVSQMPIREALKELAAQGLVEHIPYRGMRVVGFSPNDIADLYTHRGFLEGMAAYATAQHMTPEIMAELLTLQIQMEERRIIEDLKMYRKLNRRFHEIIFTASRRPYLIRTLGQLWEAFPTMLWGKFAVVAAHSFPVRDDDAPEHRAIMAALESRDAMQAEQLVRQHVKMAGNYLASFLKASE